MNYLNQYDAFEAAVEAAFAAGLRRHHSLDDTKANRLGWIAAGGDTYHPLVQPEIAIKPSQALESNREAICRIVESHNCGLLEMLITIPVMLDHSGGRANMKAVVGCFKSAANGCFLEVY